jgi:hypothetical protein
MTADNPVLEPEIEVEPTVETATDDLPEVEIDSEFSDDGEEGGEEEVEYEGRNYKVPKELKDALLRQSDYTKKTQEIAESRKSYEQQVQEFEQQRQHAAQQIQRQQQNIQGYAQLAALDAQLQQLSGIDWNSLSENDPVEAQKLFFTQSQLREQRGQIASYLGQAEQQSALMTQQEIAKQLEKGREVLAKDIKGWSPEVASSLIEHGVNNYGFTKAELSQVYDPRHVKVLHKAYLYDQLMAKAKTKPKTEVTAEPTRKVSAGASNTKDPSRMTDKEFANWRRSQIKQR